MLKTPATKIFKINPAHPDKEAINFAATLLKNGNLVIFPTETVYGIGANFLDKKAVGRLYAIKKRPPDKPFTAHISGVDMIEKLGCEITEFAGELIKEFWPGPLTIILRRTDPTCQVGFQSHLTGGKIGFRMPKNTIAKELISRSGVPVAAPSANSSGEKPPTNINEVLKSMDGKVDLILDGGETEFGRESTIVDITHSPYKILRKGALSEDKIEAVWSRLI